VLADCEGEFAALPPGIHKATLNEIRVMFVEKAPIVAGEPRRRALICDALEVYVQLLARRFEDPIIWVDGGFVTHKTWAEPDDADVVALVAPEQLAQRAFTERALALQTLDVASLSVSRRTLTDRVVKPMGALLDGYIDANTQARRDYWEYWLSSVRRPDGSISDDAQKGFVEVVIE
jgi:hypothetical protein